MIVKIAFADVAGLSHTIGRDGARAVLIKQLESRIYNKSLYFPWAHYDLLSSEADIIAQPQ